MYFEEKWKYSYLPWPERYDVIEHMIKFLSTGVKNSWKIGSLPDKWKQADFLVP